jgi:hypothetical protein
MQYIFPNYALKTFKIKAVRFKLDGQQQFSYKRSMKTEGRKSNFNEAMANGAKRGRIVTVDSKYDSLIGKVRTGAKIGEIAVGAPFRFVNECDDQILDSAPAEEIVIAAAGKVTLIRTKVATYCFSEF